MMDRFSVGNVMAEIEISSWRTHYNVSDDEAVKILDRYYDLGYSLFLTHLGSLSNSRKEVQRLTIAIKRWRFMRNIAYIPRHNLRDVLFMQRKFTKNIFFGFGPEWSLTNAPIS